MTRISNRDWEALSAYLDGQLKPREHARLTARLEADADLRTALEELRQTRAALRWLPKLRAPRNYTLSPKLVPVRPAPSRAYPVLRLASALAVLLLAVVLAGDFLSFGAHRFAPAAQPMRAVQSEATVAAAVEAAPAEVQAPFTVEVTPEVVREAAGESLAITDALTVTEAAGERAELMTLPTTTPPEPQMKTLLGEAATPTPEPEAVSAPTEAGMPAGMPADKSAETLPPAPAPEAALLGPSPTAEMQVVASPPPQPFPAPMPNRGLRILEAALAVLALITGLAAVYLRRRTTP